MYHRNSTKSHHLDRRKSTSSAKSVHLEHINPETAERDAQAAAMQAFSRAKERSSTDATLWPPPRNNNSNGTGSNADASERCSNESSLQRRRSIRFVPTRTSRSTRSHTINSNASTTESKAAVHGAESRPTSSASAAGMVSAAKGTAGDYINSFITCNEYYTPEDNIASVPSSYRKIRKSRSMLTSSEASMASRNYTNIPTSPTMSQFPTLHTGSSNPCINENIPPAGLKAPKSMSFLRGRRDQSMLFSKRRGSNPVRASNDDSIDTSNNKQEHVKSQPANFLRPKSINADRFLRKSMRNSSNDTLPVDRKIPKDGSLRHRARKVSSNFKYKLKNFFSLAKGDTEEASFPPQQIEASKSHNTSLDNPGYMNEHDFPFQSADDEAALSRVPSGIASLHAVPSHQQLRSRQGSLESLRSERRASDERSRVTSWSNSDTNTLNTMNSREWERKRLSVINEHGMHISSSTRPITPDANDVDINIGIGSLPQPATVDSQRIYSALMKRLDETNKSSQSGVQGQRSVDDFVQSGVVPPRGSSRAYEVRGHDTTPTIRHVVRDDFSDSSSTRTIERKPIAGAGEVKTEPNGSPFRSNTVSSSIAHGQKGPKDESDQLPSVPRIEEPTPPMRTLSNRSSAFFASPTCHLFRTQSPYRRAIQDSMKTESQSTQMRSPEFNPWMRSLTSLPIRRPSTCESEVDKKMQYAESVYSSEGPTIGSQNNTSAIADNFPRPPSAHGDATIFVDPPVYRPTPPLPPKHRVTSSASSVEWKTWLSANVSKLEGTSGRATTSPLEYAVPSTRSSGHVREDAQIDDENEPNPLEVYRPTRASPESPHPTPKITTPAARCVKENEAPESSTIPFRSSLRATTSLANLKSDQEAKPSTAPTKRGAFDSFRRKSLAHKPSANTLAGNLTSTRKLVKKQSGFKKYVTPTSSPGISAAVDKQFRKINDSTDSLKRKFGIAASAMTENISPKGATDRDVDPYGTQGSGVLGPEVDMTPQSVGSKKMVDLFLSSRRKRVASGEDGSVFV
ncbi:hypothetical protein F4819DRAFT_506577 [Hypoxylon fuscum]|nr:hypothetical protein F4819DRAFT_506577 [Hypoxylon fuscum]